VAGGLLLLQEARRSALDARRKTTFVANVSHELKTPLTTIRMYAELLGEGRVRDEAKVRHYLRTIVGESQRLSRLIGNVLDFGRLEQGRKEYRVEALDPADTVSDILARQRERLEAAGLKVETTFPPAAARVRADRDSLEQVLLNLVDNALKYAAAGGELHVAVVPAGAQVQIRVEDRGPGVPAAQRERVFDLFHRLDDELTRRQPGCGLGLTLARRLLRDQGGDLGCEARPGGGAAFIVSLPAAAAVRVPEGAP
jgi:signal transduction histidine kinase